MLPALNQCFALIVPKQNNWSRLFTLTAPRPDAEGEDGRAEGARRRHETHLKLAEAVAHHAVVTCNFIALLSET